MSASFDPYLEWLKIPAARRPPSHYDLLGLPPFEANAERIHQASLDRTNLLRQFMLGPQATDACRLSTQVSAAYAVLSDPEKKLAYDGALQPRGNLQPKESMQEAPDVSTASGRILPASQSAHSIIQSQASQSHVWIVAATVAVAVTLLGLIVAFINWTPKGDATIEIAGNLDHELPKVVDDKTPTPPQPENPLPARGEPKSVTEVSKSPPDKPQTKPEVPPQEPLPKEAPKSEQKSDPAAPSPEAGEKRSATKESPPNPVNSAETQKPPATADHNDNEKSLETAPAQQPSGGVPTKASANDPSPVVTKPISLRDPFPSGRVFSLSIFDVQFKAPKENDPELVVIKRPNGSVCAMTTHIGGKLDGVAVGEHENKKPMVLATYRQGSRDGVLKTWDDTGRPVLFAQYKSGRPHGFTCYFDDGKMRLLIDYKLDQIKGLRLMKAEEVLAEFPNETEARHDPTVSALLEQLDDVEKTLVTNEAAFRKQVRKAEDARRQKLAASNGPGARARTQQRINQHGAEEAAVMRDMFRRAVTGR